MVRLIKYFTLLQHQLFLFCIQNIFCYSGLRQEARHDLRRSDQIYKCQENFVLNKEVPSSPVIALLIFNCEWFWSSVKNIIIADWYLWDLNICVNNETLQEARGPGDCGSSTDWTEVWPGIYSSHLWYHLLNVWRSS